MSLDNKSLFSFMGSEFTSIINNAQKMGELIYQDPNAAMTKARMFAEDILVEVYKKEDINIPYLRKMFEKISYLAQHGYITGDVQKLFDTIRFSGNKAAHDANFNDITVAFRLHRTMYDIAVWFCEVYGEQDLLIPTYEHPQPPVAKEENLQDLIKTQILELMGTGSYSKNIVEVPSQAVEGQLEKTPPSVIHITKNDSYENKGYLIREVTRLQDSSQEAIENASTFSAFKNYMHVERKIQRDLESILVKNKISDKSNLILLCGSVGDGKSHLLAYLKENKSQLLEGYTIFNDATESHSPNMDAMETLQVILSDFSDQNIDHSDKKVILAINMGVLHNFISSPHEGMSYERLQQFVSDSGLFTQNVVTSFSRGNLDLISFGDYHSYELTKDGPTSHFFSTIFQKVFGADESNPFYIAYQRDVENKIDTIVHQNYKFLQNEFVQKQIVSLVIQVLIKNKLVLSTRAFLNFIADILIPDGLMFNGDMSEFQRLDNAVPSLIFQRRERSPILKALHELDPIHMRSAYIDNIIIELNTLHDLENIIGMYVKSGDAIEWLQPLVNEEGLAEYTFSQFAQNLLRLAYLTNAEFTSQVQDSVYQSYMKYLLAFNHGDNNLINTFYKEIKEAIFKWKGSPGRDYVYINKKSNTQRLAQSLNLQPTATHLKFIKKDILESFKASIVLAYHNGNLDEKVFLEIDYPLYRLLVQVREGYCPNKKDEEDAIKFVEFTEQIMQFGNKKNELLVHFLNENKLYTLKHDSLGLGRYVFEKE